MMLAASLLCLSLVATGTASLSISATCDNQMKLYFDGVLQTPGPNANNWRYSDTSDLLASTSVVGIECYDQGVVPGIMASLSDGTFTDSSWQCSNVFQNNWSSPQFDASSWSHADTHGTNEDGGYAGWSEVANINRDAYWIWNSFSRNDLTVYCRKIVRAAFDCEENNPCDGNNERFYFPHTEAAKFVQCSEHGQCYVMPCAAGTEWNEISFTCVHSDTGSNGQHGATTTRAPTTTTPVVTYDCGDNNPCALSNTRGVNFYYAHADESKFVQCDKWGQCFIMPCAAGTKWSQAVHTCIHA